MARYTYSSLGRLLLVAHGTLAALTVDVEDVDSVKAAAALVVEDLLTFYGGNKTDGIPGIFSTPPPSGDYNQWTGAVLWDNLLKYRNRTGDTQYDDIITAGFENQLGLDEFLPADYMNTMGNDDQAIWALSGLEAEMTGFQPVPGKAQWLDIAQNVFSQQTGRRIENGGCEGALRWLLFEGTEGYNYVNSASSIGYFEVGAQLAYLTGNTTYIDLADDTFELLEVLDFVTVDYAVYDGAHMDSCTDVNKLQLSYTAAMLLEGSAYLYNLTSDDDWKERIDGLLDRILMTFFENGVALETSCEKGNRCNTDMLFYKGIMLRRLASAMEMAPYTAARILPVLKSSAKAAAAHCTGGDNGRMCGFRWTSGHFDGETGAAQQADVLSALLAVIDVHSAGGSGNGSGKGFDMPQGTGARAGMSVSAFVGALLAGGFLLL